MAPKPIPRWVNGNEHHALTALFALDQLEPNVFQSAFPAYSPGNQTRAYGGHVFAQSVLAAARTVKPGMFAHSATGHFLQIGYTNRPFTYRVSVVRDGGGYCQRRIDVTQNPAKGLMFTCVASFKMRERSTHTRGHEARLDERYGGLLSSRAPEEWPEAPGVDSPFWTEVEKENGVDKFPGLEMRKVNLDEWNGEKGALDKRVLMFYRALGEVPRGEEAANLWAAGHFYASDRNGLFPIPNFLGLGNSYSAIASLSHTVIMHCEPDEFDLVGADGQAKWFVIEESVEHIGHGRGLIQSTIWDWKEQRPILRMVQDGMLRFREGVEQRREGGVFNKEKL